MVVKMICDTDEIARCIVFEQFFRDGFHINDLLFQFSRRDDADGNFHESGVLRRLAPADDDVHMIGCNLAAHQNAPRLPQGKDRRYYCGFRNVVAGRLPKKGTGFELRLENTEELGNKAHVDFILIVSGTRSERALNRTAVGLAMAEEFGPVIAHVCQVDLEDSRHPSRLYGAGYLDVPALS
jgi:hypothetical protein